MFQPKIAEWSYYLGCLGAAAAIVYRAFWFGGLGARIYGTLHVLPYQLAELSLLLLVVSIASNAHVVAHRG